MENVWDYPRPPALEPVAKTLRIVFAGQEIAATTAAWRVLETSHPPVYYLPREAFTGCTLEPAFGRSLCEWKGEAVYWTIRAGGRRAVYAGPMDACYVGEEAATPQPGGFYGGWITRDVTGPFKGGPGSMGW